MSRTLFGPGSICDNCGKPDWVMGSEGIVCYFCFAGVFVHRKFWVYTYDEHEDVTATPRSDLTLQELRDEWLRIADRYRRRGDPMPELVAERVRWAMSVPRAGTT
jgi:hypothetical protein